VIVIVKKLATMAAETADPLTIWAFQAPSFHPRSDLRSFANS
jgi:hypothetical protein